MDPTLCSQLRWVPPKVCIGGIQCFQIRLQILTWFPNYQPGTSGRGAGLTGRFAVSQAVGRYRARQGLGRLAAPHTGVLLVLIRRPARNKRNSQHREEPSSSHEITVTVPFVTENYATIWLPHQTIRMPVQCVVEKQKRTRMEVAFHLFVYLKSIIKRTKKASRKRQKSANAKSRSIQSNGFQQFNVCSILITQRDSGFVRAKRRLQLQDGHNLAS